MELTPGTRLGPYEIVGPIGAGGMGEVYRATDSNLKRSVAIKVLPAAVLDDADRLVRFQREAEVLAALNHPNIAAIYGVEKTVDLTAIVMELVDGEDLSALIDRGPGLSLADALSIARQVADALDTAHEQGIVHRDLKPANIKVRGDGTVKVLDFGLAKTSEGTGSGGGTGRSNSANSPTMTSPAMTAMGIILGTAAYMSPEQAKGRVVDKRADIWAFGVVLYEMVTGKRAFEGEDVSDLLVAVLSKDVDLEALPSGTPPRLRALIRDCLVRDPRQRLRDIGDARIVLDRIVAGTPDGPAAVNVVAAAPPSPLRFVWPAIAIIAVAIAAGLAAQSYWGSEPVPDQVRFYVSPPEGATAGALPARISPDGRKLAYGATQGARPIVHVYDLETGTDATIPGTEGFRPAVFEWSPGSDAIAIVGPDQTLRAVSLQGVSRTVAKLDQIFTGAWGADDMILLGPVGLDGPIRTIAKVKASGGKLEPATALDAAKSETLHRLPTFLPDGRFAFLALSPGSRVTYASSVDSTERHLIPDISSRMEFSQTHVFYTREEMLFARPFDLRRLAFAGEERRLAEGVGSGGTPFSVSRTGTLAYRSAAEASKSRFAWFDRSGRELAKVGPVGEYADIELSRDDRYVAYEAGSPGDIWVLDLQNGLTQQVTSNPAREADPVWSPDTKTIAFRSDGAKGRMYTRAFGMVGSDMPLFEGTTRDSPSSWSKDGKYIVYESEFGLWAVQTTGDQKPFRVTSPTSTGAQGNGQLSPDGRWLAYQSGELGAPEVFVQAFPGPGARQKVSLAGGVTPRWSADGKELFYLDPSGTLMAVAISSTGQAIDVRAPIPLFATGLPQGGEHGYAVASTGRFLVAVRSVITASPPVTVVLNWR